MTQAHILSPSIPHGPLLLAGIGAGLYVANKAWNISDRYSLLDKAADLREKCADWRRKLTLEDKVNAYKQAKAEENDLEFEKGEDGADINNGAAADDQGAGSLEIEPKTTGITAETSGDEMPGPEGGALEEGEDRGPEKIEDVEDGEKEPGPSRFSFALGRIREAVAKATEDEPEIGESPTLNIIRAGIGTAHRKLMERASKLTDEQILKVADSSMNAAHVLKDCGKGPETRGSISILMQSRK